MKLTELIEMLTDLADEFEHSGHDADDVDVLLAYQRHYPLAGTVETVTADLTRSSNDDGNLTVWIAERGQQYGNPYAPAGAWGGEAIENDRDDD